MRKEDSLCWSCKRATSDRLCPWVGGKAVDGWQAEQTELTHYMNGTKYITKSYKVNSCPLYVRDYKYTKVKELAQLLGVSVSTIQRIDTADIRTMLKEKGFNSRVYKLKSQRKGKSYIRREVYIKPI